MDSFRALLEKDFYYSTDVWTYFNTDVDLPRQGFKIHISAHLENYIDIYQQVVPYLRKNNLSFKVISSTEKLEALNVGLLGLTQIGKFITIYIVEELEKHLEALFEIVSKYDGPIVSSDLRYKKSNIYFRYGVINADDGKEEYLLNPLGEYVLDSRKKSDAIPYWVDFKFEEENENKLLNNLIILSQLRARGRGSVFSGLLKQESFIEKVIIKEARPYGEYISSQDNAKNRLDNEALILKHIEHLNIAPTIIEKREESDHCLLIMEQIQGQSLKCIIQQYESFSTDFINTIEKELYNTINSLHSEGVYHGDITPDNIIIADRLYLIDFEHSVLWNKNTKIHNYGSIGFYPIEQDNKVLEQKDLEERDLYGVNKCIYALKNISWYKELIHA